MVGLIAGLAGVGRSADGRAAVNADGTATLRTVRAAAFAPAILVLIGVLALRAAVIFSAQ